MERTELLVQRLREAGLAAVSASTVFMGRRVTWPYALIPRWGVAVTVGRRTSTDRARDKALQLEGWLVVRGKTVDDAVAQTSEEIDALRARAPYG